MSSARRTQSLGMWTAVRTGDGSITLAHPGHGETCHSHAGAWTQARERYARPCRIRERALELCALGRTHLALLDVGTGLGLNIAAAIEAVEDTDIALDITSLESDPRVIEAAIAIGPQPIDALERIHARVRAALARALDPTLTHTTSKSLTSNNTTSMNPVAMNPVAMNPVAMKTVAMKTVAMKTVAMKTVAMKTVAMKTVAIGRHRLSVHIGDGHMTLAALDPLARFDAVFLDPFSPRVDPDLWEPHCLRSIALRMAPRSLLSTYSAAVRVRAGLRAAGLHVGPGPRVQAKAQGTLASPDPLDVSFDARAQRRLDTRAARLEATSDRLGGIPQGNGFPINR